MRTCWVLLVLLLLSSPGVLAQQADTSARDAAPTNAHPSVDVPPALDRVLRDYETAWRNRDPEALAALFTRDGFVLRGGEPPVRGREAIQEAYRDAGGRLHLRALAYEQAGDVAYIVGGYTSTPKWPDAGKFVLALRKDENGRWLIAADMDNRNRRQ